MEWRNILVRAPNWVGDLVMATGSMADLRRSFPGARITVLLPPSRMAVLRGGAHFDALIPDPGKSLEAVWRLSRDLRARRFDLALVYPNSVRSALAPWMARIPVRIGYGGGFRRLLLTRSLPEPGPRPPGPPEPPCRGAGPRRLPTPMASRYAALAAASGARAGDGRPTLAVSAGCEERSEARRRELGIPPGERLIGLNPGSSFGASKLWSAERFARLGDLLSERLGRRIILFVGPGEEAIGRRIASLLRSPAIDTGGAPLDLELLKPFVRDLDLLVTTDTGTRHYAVAFRVPVVVVMGPTHPGFTAAHLEETEVVRKDVPCGPCHLKVCPTDHRCMTLIEPEEVLARSLALLERTGRSAGP